ncbi:MAG: RICIN domain-containing protein [Polaribacter sp.]
MKKIAITLILFAITFSLKSQNLNGKTFKIQSTFISAKGKMIDASGGELGRNGTNIQLWDNFATSEHQNWQFVYANKGRDLYYIICASPRAGKHKYLDADFSTLGKENARIQLWENNNGSPNQLWKVSKSQYYKDSYTIVSMHPKAKGAKLEVNRQAGFGNGGKIVLSMKFGASKQAWKLIPLGSNANTLNAGQKLSAGQKLVSANGKFMLLMQATDGNLCVYNSVNGRQGRFVWGSMKYGFKNARLEMQTDGNLVVYDASNKARWSSNTHPYNDAKFRNPKNKPVKLTLENDGKLKLYTKSGVAVWSSN